MLKLLLSFSMQGKSSDAWLQPLRQSEVSHLILIFSFRPVGSSWDMIPVSHICSLFVVLMEAYFRYVQ